MAAFRNFSDPCCPRLPKSYREIQRRIERQNYGVDNGKYMWNSSKSDAKPYICKGKEPNRNEKRNFRTTDSILNQPKGLRKDQSALCKEISRLLGGSYDHEQNLRKEARAQEEKDNAIVSQNQVEKGEAQVKFQQLLDINQHQVVWEPLNNPYGDHLGQEKSELYEEKSSKQTPEKIERALLHLFPKVRRRGKNEKKLNKVPSFEYTPLERKEKIQKAKDVRMIREFLAGLPLPSKKTKGIPQKYTSPGSFRSLQKSYQNILDSSFHYTDPFDQMLQGNASKVPDLYPLLRSKHLVKTSSPVINPRKKTTKVGAKFSLNFRNKLKAKAMDKPRMSKLKGRKVEIPELRSALKSRQKILKKGKTRKEEKSAGKSSSALKNEPEPNYGLNTTATHKSKNSKGINPPISEQFHNMSYREIQRRIKRQNYGVDNGKYMWNSSKSYANPYIYKGKESDKNEKRNFRTPERWPTDSILNQPKGIRKDQSALCKEISRLQGGSYDHEQNLRKEAKAQEEKDNAIVSQNQVKKREAQVKFQQVLDINRHQIVWEPLKNPYGDHLGQEKPDPYEEKSSKQTPEEIEKALLHLFPKVRRHGKNKKNLNKVPSSEYTPLERKEKIQKAKDVRKIREFLALLPLPSKKTKGIPQKYTTPGSFRSLQKSYQNFLDSSFHWIDKPPPHTDPFDQMAAKVPELHPLLRSKHLMKTSSPVINPKKKTTRVGAKFSWNFRNKLKAKAMDQPKMSKPFDEMLKGREVEIPELRSALKSRQKILKKGKTRKEEKSASSALKNVPEPNYGLNTTAKHKSKNSKRINPPISEQFHNMLKGKEATMLEMKAVLMSHHKIHKKSSTESKYEFTTPPKDSRALEQMRQDEHENQPNMSKPFDEMLKGREAEIPELNSALKSRMKILKKRNIKKEEKSSSGLEKEPEPNYGLYTTESHKPKQSHNIKPLISQQFHKMLKGKEGRMPEMKKVLMSRHNIEKTSSSESDLYEITTPPKDSQALEQIGQATDKQIDFDEVSILSSKRSRRFSLPGKTLHLKKFYHYIKDSTPDRMIMEKRGSKRSIAYLGRNSISSLGSGKTGWVRLSVEMPENSGRTGGSIITTTDIARPTLAVGAKKGMEMVERKDEEDVIFDTLPEDYKPQENQDPNLKKTLSELIAGIARAERAKKKFLSKRDKHRPKANESPQDPEQEVRRISAVSLKSVRDEIKQFESQALKQQREREQYEENFLVEEKAAVQARIQELMKYVVIREDYRPPKPPRDFVTENILRLQKKRGSEVKEKRESNIRYPSMVENLYSNRIQQIAPPRPKIIRRYRDFTGSYEKGRLSRQQNHQQSNPKEPIQPVKREKHECDICDLLTRGSKTQDSDFIQKTKPKKLWKTDRAWSLEEEDKEWCPKHC